MVSHLLITGAAAVPFGNFTILPFTGNTKSQAAAISPDGKYILFEVDDAGKASLRLYSVPTDSDEPILAPEDAYYEDFQFSPDGNYFSFRKTRKSALDVFDLYRVPVIGHNPQIIARHAYSNAAFSPNGKHIAYERINDSEAGTIQLLVANADGTDEKTIADRPLASGHSFLAWSPDGKRIALTGNSTLSPGPIQLMDVASGKTKDFAETKGIAFYDSVWMPDGSGLLVLYRDWSKGLNHNQIGFVTYPGGHFYKITNDASSYQSLTLSAATKTLATVEVKQYYNLDTIPAKGNGANPFAPAMPQQQKEYLNFSWAANGSFYLADETHLSQVPFGGGSQAMLRSGIRVKTVSACPDGQALLLTVIGHGGGNGTNIWGINPDGTNLKQLSGGQHDDSAECSPDSKWAYYVEENTNRVERVSLEGGMPETLPGTPIPHAFISGSYLGLSPDGKSLALLIDLSEGNPAPKIAVVPIDAGPQPMVRLLDPHPGVWDAPRFTPDGKALVYPIAQTGSATLWLQPLDGSAGRQVTIFNTEPIVALRWSPDGKKIGVLTRRIEANVVLLHDSTDETQ